MSENWVFDEIKCTIKITSVRAFFVSFRNEKHVWIPQSIVKNIDDIQMYDHTNEQVLQIPTWFIEKNNINGWY